MDDSISKMEKPVSVITEDLTLLAPGESLSSDFFDYQNESYMFIYAEKTGNKTMETACKVVKKYITTYGLPHEIKTDQGPGYQSGFSDFLKGHHIIHKYTSAYHPKLNVGSERAVRLIKDVLKRDGRKITRKI